MLKKIFLIILIIGTMQAKNAIVVGASSGMGREIAKLLSDEGYTVGLVARRVPFLKSLQAKLKNKSYIKRIDITEPNAREKFSDLLKEMGKIDLVVLSVSATLDVKNSMSENNDNYTWAEKEKILDVCAKGFIAIADIALEYFIEQNSGHLVGISSTSGLRGASFWPEYSAAKACISTYMEGIRNYLIQNKVDVYVSDVIPGYVAVEYSPMGTDPNAYWETTVQEAGKIIMQGIKKKKKIIYVPKYKGWITACLLSILPDYIYNHYLPWI